MTELSGLRVGAIAQAPFWPEPLEVLSIVDLGDSKKLICRGLRSGLVHDPVLAPEQLRLVSFSGLVQPLDGDPSRFRLGVEGLRLGLAYEYDPFFSLSIARVDPLPHQLEAVYDYFLRLPRIRFLLADDPGAGKTIMAGLLLKELKARGLVRRVLVVTPANLTFQWQRELKDKFRESFEIIRGETLRSAYGQNPWQERDQVITSISWVSRIEDAKESLLRSSWDLIIVDEAHKMSAYAEDRKTLAYRLGESLSSMTDHYLLMTATPHKGDPTNFCLFLSLLDKDVYGNVRSLEEAMRRGEAPFYLRRTKEALISFPDPDTGEVKSLFTKREVSTATFELDGEEFDFYDALTRYVEDQSIQASADGSARGRAVGFAMAMLQRRMASSVYAVRRSLERMRERRQKILDNPDAYRRQQLDRLMPNDFDDMTDDEQQGILDELEAVVISFDPIALREDIARLTSLINQAKVLEQREVETKLVKLRQVLLTEGVFKDPKMKLLLFTEHKDTLDYLGGDGRDGRPLGKLREWGLTVTQIHGGMKIGDRDASGSRLGAEREFREDVQVLVATEAAGEGINLQFCWFMINYDIPWNPVRLEQRMGRIHRYGQEHDCLIYNFAAVNTREGRVLEKLMERLKEIRHELGTDQVFDVVGEIFPANQLERMFRELYARRTALPDIEARIVRDVSPERFRAITESTLESLAKKELNLSAIVGRSVEAKERRLVPEVIESFFTEASPLVGLTPKATARDGHIYRIGKVPRALVARGHTLEPRFGRLAREYQRIAFDKAVLQADPTIEWVTPGHPLFESVREAVVDIAEADLRKGAVFYDLHRGTPYCLDLFGASVKDGRGQTLHRRLFVIETTPEGEMEARQPTVFLDIIAPSGSVDRPNMTFPAINSVESFLLSAELRAFAHDVTAERTHEIDMVREHIEISLNVLIDRQQRQLAEYLSRQTEGGATGVEGIIAQAEQHLDDLNERLDRRRSELELERHCTIADVVHIARAIVAPHPDRATPPLAPIVRDEEVERRAVEVAMEYERSRGWSVESVERENRGFDLVSRRPHPQDPGTAIEVRFIEVKGRAGIGEIGLTSNEYHTAERLGNDYWLYAVFNCSGEPALHVVRDPARLGWKPITQVEHYKISSDEITAKGDKIRV